MISEIWRSQLAAEQLEDGSWGRFHTMDTKLRPRRRFPTTEAALARARDLELTKDDEIVKKAISLMERYLSGEDKWTDAHEKHYGFDIAFNAFLAANINLFDPANPSAEFAKHDCARLMHEACAGGGFDESVWEAGMMRDDIIMLRAYMVHIIWLLRDNPFLDARDEQIYFDYIWHRPEGVYYRYDFECARPVRAGDKRFDSWLTTLEELKGLPSFKARALSEAREHLENQIYRLRNEKIDLPANTSRLGRYAASRKNTRVEDLVYRINRILTV